MGVVWSASPGDAAVKIGHSAAPLVLARFGREAAALDAIGGPAVPALFDHGALDDGRPFIAMERLRGDTLAALLGRGRPPLHQVIELTTSLASSLEAVHRAGFMHRDLKPANIFVAGARVVLLDFGLARRSGDLALTRAGTVAGTIAYASPEQLAGAELDERSDLYALGAVLYELLTGALPFAGDAAAVERGHLMLRPRPPSALAELPPALEAVCLRLLAKSPAGRPTTAAEVRALVLAAAAGAPSPPMARTGEPKRGALRSATQPVLLLGCAGGDRAPLADVVARYRGFIARERGKVTIAVFAAGLTADPLGAAIAAAREAARLPDVEVALHLDKLLLRQRGSGQPAAYGMALEEPSWMERARGDDLRVTAELAAVAPMLPAAAAAPLCGRAAEIAELGASLEGIAGTGAELVTLAGAAGLGKSRLLDEAARLAAAASFSVERARVPRSAGKEPAFGERLLDQLGAATPPPGRGAAMVHELAAAIRRRAAAAPLALLIDDVHLADNTALDALEAAVSAAEGLPLWLVVTADPSFDRARPGWGKRADRSRLLRLEPLDEAAAIELAAHHLRPAEYPPTDALRTLARFAGCRPRLLADLAASLKQMGAVRRHATGATWSLATEVLGQLSASTGAQWVAARRLARLPGELAAFVRLCALLGAVDVDELRWMLEHLDRDNVETSRIDPAVGVVELALAGWLERGSFASEALRAAVVEQIRPADRALLHRYALRYAVEIDDVARTARHARACGDDELAAGAFCRLARAAVEDAALLDAELYATSALEHLSGDTRLRAEVLLCRGKVRYHFNRCAEAVEDLIGAAAIAAALGETALQAEALLEQATALDWMWEYGRSAEVAEQAAALVAGLADPRLDVRLELARGRAAWRADRLIEAAGRLERVIESAAAIGDRDTEVVARLVLPVVAVLRGELEAAERWFESAIAFCERAGDIAHLNVAYCNRVLLWQARNLPAAALEDSRRAAELARETGQPMLEAASTHNLAELLFFRGDDDEALTAARRAHLLHERFADPMPATAHLLMARICAARGELDEAGRYIEATRAALDEDASAADRLLLEALVRRGDWSELCDEAAAAPVEVAIEVHFWAAADAARRGDDAALDQVLERLEPLLDERPMWRRRVERLTASGNRRRSRSRSRRDRRS